MYWCIKIFEVFWNSLSLLNIEVKGVWEFLIIKYKEGGGTKVLYNWTKSILNRDEVM